MLLAQLFIVALARTFGQARCSYNPRASARGHQPSSMCHPPVCGEGCRADVVACPGYGCCSFFPLGKGFGWRRESKSATQLALNRDLYRAVIYSEGCSACKMGKAESCCPAHCLCFPLDYQQGHFALVRFLHLLLSSTAPSWPNTRMQ